MILYRAFSSAASIHVSTFVCMLAILVIALPAGAATRFSPPLGERWFSIELNGERTGFAKQRIAPAGNGYELTGEAGVKMKVLGFTRQSSSWEKYRVNQDMTLRSFTIEQVIDGSRMKLSGEASPGELKVVTETAGIKKEKKFKFKGAVYPPPAVNFYPLMEKKHAGKKLKVTMFDPEAVKVKDVKIKVVGTEVLPDGTRTLHLQNDLYSIVSNDIWIDFSGNTMKESVRDGLVMTVAEDAESAARFIAEAAVAKKDMILDFSRIMVDPPLQRPEVLNLLAVELSGIPENLPLLQGAGQKVIRLDREKVLFTMYKPGLQHPGTDGTEEKELLRKNLESTPQIPVDAPEIVSATEKVAGEEKDPLQVAGKLARWVAQSVTDAVTDAHSPLETLQTGKGNCQSHARLYTAMARSAGIPTRFVSGLVYMADQGFLYHSWAESYVGFWLPVDPTFGQVPADVTHIKLVEGELPEDLLPLAGIIGRVRATVTAQK